jgi:lipopolysaccharide transport system permease protein
MIRVLSSAFSDIRAGFDRRAVWITLATEDISDQHRRTTLGPIWLLLNYLAFAVTFIYVFRGGEGDARYATYAAVGLLVFLYILDVISMGVSVFEREASFINGTTLPISVYVMRLTLQTMIRSGYAMIGCLGLVLLAGEPITPAWLWALPGLLLIVLVTPAVITVFGFAGAFFPDISFVVSNLMRVMMFITPVFWEHGGEGGLRGALYDFNPIAHFIELVRRPIVDGVIPVNSYAVALITGVIMWGAAIFLLGRFRRQIALIL